MALADYRLCDWCGDKAFYDTNLSYEEGPSEYSSTPPFRVAGQEQFADAEMSQKYGMRLGYLGDWAVLCEDCAKTHRTAIVPIAVAPTEPTEAQIEAGARNIALAYGQCDTWESIPSNLKTYYRNQVRACLQAAMLANWHAAISGTSTAMRPGIDQVARGIESVTTPTEGESA